MDIIMIKYGEIILKGLNRPLFEDRLVKNIKYKLYGLGEIKIKRCQATFYIVPANEGYDYDEAISRLKKVFGIIWISRVTSLEKDMAVIKDKAYEALVAEMEGKHTFKVEVKRPDKKFPLKSPDIQQDVGGFLYSKVHKDLKVDVKNPDITVMVEIREEGAYVYVHKEKGAGGLPLGINGKCGLLLSGGIDSPVAGYMIAKRGVELIGIHFHSYPYTSERAKNKVIELARLMTEYVGRMELFVVPFTDIQLEINDKCPEEILTVIMRRYMMRIAEKIAVQNGCGALVTGESLGQVASQTIDSLNVTNSAVSLPVFRPLIGMDKEDIIKISREIDTYDTSILPYEDCCTVFVPKHPKTKPKNDFCEKAEKLMPNIDELVEKAVENTEKIVIKTTGVVGANKQEY